MSQQLEQAQRRSDFIELVESHARLMQELREQTLLGNYSRALGILEAASAKRTSLHLALASQVREDFG